MLCIWGSLVGDACLLNQSLFILQCNNPFKLLFCIRVTVAFCGCWIAARKYCYGNRTDAYSQESLSWRDGESGSEHCALETRSAAPYSCDFYQYVESQNLLSLLQITFPVQQQKAKQINRLYRMHSYTLGVKFCMFFFYEVNLTCFLLLTKINNEIKMKSIILGYQLANERFCPVQEPV